jgi:phosphoserine phosphatase
MPDELFQPRRADWAPFELIFFDCDSTLTTLEGIDELARWQGRAAEVAELTTQAMNGDVPLEAVYGRRLDLLQPTREQLRRLGQAYAAALVPGAAEVVAALLAAGRKLFIVSGGLAEAVRDLGVGLGIPAEHIHAVHTAHDELSGRWWERWNHPHGRNPDERYQAHDAGPLTLGAGKADIVRRLRAQHRGRAMLVGDGSSDLEARASVDLFVGFGGVVARQRVLAEAEVFVHGPGLEAILPLALARPAIAQPHAAIYAAGVAALMGPAVAFKHSAARDGLLARLDV